MVYKASFFTALCASVRRFSTPVTKHKSTGRSVMSKDMTRGYGPVEYLIRTANTGTYKIGVRVNSPIT